MLLWYLSHHISESGILILLNIHLSPRKQCQGSQSKKFVTIYYSFSALETVVSQNDDFASYGSDKSSLITSQFFLSVKSNQSIAPRVMVHSRLRDWPDTHCGAIYCCIGLPDASLTRLSRLAAGRPRVQQMALQCVSGKCLRGGPALNIEQLLTARGQALVPSTF